MVTEEEKQKAIADVLKVLKKTKKSMRKAYYKHLMKTRKAANDETRNDKGD